MKRIATAIVIILFAVGFDNCSTDMKVCTKEVPAAQLAAINQTKLASDAAAIDAYLTKNGLTATADGFMRYNITNPGSGVGPCLESSISVNYTGKLMTNGTIFDSSLDPINPAVFTLNTLIMGWQLGFLKLSKGGTATLYVPSGYSYGPTGSGKIPANSNLIFDVTLIDFVN
jgi:FKBP-type peptidyl-prolyl cis-trans isomerase FkpA